MEQGFVKNTLRQIRFLSTELQHVKWIIFRPFYFVYKRLMYTLYMGLSTAEQLICSVVSILSAINGNQREQLRDLRCQ